MKKHALIFSVVLSGLFLWGCYPDGPDYVEEMDVVTTYHNPDYDFAAGSTYVMPDMIVEITGNLAEGEKPKLVNDVYAQPILNAIADNMDELGWTRVITTDSATIASADLVLLVSAVKNTTLVYYYDYWYWWYGGYYPPYYGGGYYSSYTVGTLLMTMFDPERFDFGGNTVNQWTGAANGLLTGYGNISRVTNAIDQAFSQSPYLKTN